MIVDEYGDKLVAPTPVPQTSVVAPPPPVPTVAPATTTTTMQSQIQETPEYKQAMENVSLWGKQQQGTLDFNALMAQQQSQLALSQVGAGDTLASQADALRQQQAWQGLEQRRTTAEMERTSNDRAFGQQQKYVREALGSRGNAGGQLGFELGNLQFSYDQFVQAQGLNADNAEFAYDLLLKEIDLGGRQRALQNSLDTRRLGLQSQQAAAEKTFGEQNLALAIAQRNGEALMAVQAQLAQLWWDETTGQYVGPNSERLSLAQALQSMSLEQREMYAANLGGMAASQSLYDTSNVKQMGF